MTGPTFTLLFFDDSYLHRRENLCRRIGTPALVPEATFQDPYLDTAWGYPTVLRHPESGRWRCYYQGQLATGDPRVPVMIESVDGIHWQVPDLTEAIPLPGRVCPHQIYGRERFLQWSGPYVDWQATGTDAWLKGLVVYRASDELGLHSSLIASADGLRWREVEGAVWHARGADPIACAFWNPYRQSHVIVSRPGLNDRRIALHETRDWHTFTPPELALQADALDGPCAEIYGMPVVPYEHLFVGLVWVFHPEPAVDAANKYFSGKINCQLAYSHNGWHFQRTLREPFLANAESGEHGSGCIYPFSVVPDGDVLRIYSSAAKGEHGQIRMNPASGQSALLQHTLRRDGFVFLEPPGGVGTAVTRLVRWDGGEPELNVNVAHGEARVQVLTANGEPVDGCGYDDCIPFRGDSTAWVPEWRDGRLLAALRDRILRLEVSLTSGRLYAIRGQGEVQMAYEARIFAELGVRTLARPGFS